MHGSRPLLAYASALPIQLPTMVHETPQSPLEPRRHNTETELSTGLANTVAAWGTHYFEDYLTPSPLPAPQNAPPPVPQQVDARTSS
jgi:hypothetical protein